MKRAPIHLIDEPKDTRALRTACGIDCVAARGTPRLTKERKKVTCRNCLHDAGSGAWSGSAGYHYETLRTDAPRLSYAPERATAPAGASLKPIAPPMPKAETRRERIARVQRRKARRKSK